MSKCIRKMWVSQILHHHASLASSLNCLIKTCQFELNLMWGCLSFHVKYGTPLNFDLHQPSCHVIMHHIAHCTCIDLCYIPLVCAFGSSRVEPEYEQFEQEYEHPQEDRACASTADLTGEPPPPFTYFTVSCSFDLMLSLCCDSVVSRVLFHLLPIYLSYTSSPYLLFVVC